MTSKPTLARIKSGTITYQDPVSRNNKYNAHTVVGGVHFLSKFKASSNSWRKHYADAKLPRGTGRNFNTGSQHGLREILDILRTPGFCFLSPSMLDRKAAIRQSSASIPFPNSLESRPGRFLSFIYCEFQQRHLGWFLGKYLFLWGMKRYVLKEGELWVGKTQCKSTT